MAVKMSKPIWFQGKALTIIAVYVDLVLTTDVLEVIGNEKTSV